ncbi:MAG: D-aminoacylase [Candidatus Cloacimonetes bacterium]|nr:D-aminoacylase [Candidatus Cloacimonadota bacterium]
MLDMVIKNGRIVDGTGKAAFKCDIAVKDGKIDSLGAFDGSSAEYLIDARGQVVAPGFIDCHTHSDRCLPIDPEVENKLAQGITTELCGLCGFTSFPISEKTFPVARRYFASDGIIEPPLYGSYESFGQYLDWIDSLKLSHNMGMFVGEGAIRLAVMGLENRKPTKSEMKLMVSLTEEALDCGAIGLSSGLKYAPGSFSTNDEMTELCKAVGEKGKVYESHIRSQGEFLEESVHDTLDMARLTRCTAIVSHHKALGKQYWGKVRRTVAEIHDYHDKGFKVGHNVYPYVAASTTLMASLPPSVLSMDHARIIAMLKDEECRKKLESAIFNPVEKWDNDLLNSGYSGLMVLNAPSTPDAQGLFIDEFAKLRRIPPFDAFALILSENDLQVDLMNFSISEDDMRFVLSDPLSVVGSDSIYVKGQQFTHPRAFGTFPRILGKYVMGNRLLGLEEAVRKMTGQTAMLYGIPNKGFIKPGFDADLTIFDPDTVEDLSDYSNTMAPNVGISYVIVNGRVAMRDNAMTEERAGKLIRF